MTTWSEVGRRWISPQRRTLVVAVLAVLAGAGSWIAIVLAVPSDGPPVQAGLLLLLAVFGGLLLGESLRLHLERGGQTYSVSLSEVPLVIGALALPAPELLLAFLGAGAVVNVVNRVAPAKMAFNLGLYALQAAALVLALRVVGGSGATDPATWAAVFLGVAAGGAVSSFSVAQAIAFVQGGRARSSARSRGMFVTTQAAGFLAATSALLIVVVLRTSATASVLIVVLLVGLGLAYASYSRLLRRRASLERFNVLARRTHGTADPTELLATSLQETGELFGASRVLMWLSNPESRTDSDGVDLHVAARTGTGGWEDGADRLARLEPGTPPAHAVQGRETQVGRGDSDAAAQWAASEGGRDAMVVPLVGSRTVLGALAVVGREGSAQSWDADDLALLGTVAAHVGGALENSHLMTRLRHEATHDTLTGLPNSSRLLAAMEDHIAADRSFGLVLLGLDSMPEIVDTLGHTVGDLLLTEVARRLLAQAGEDVTVARVGSDFALLVANGPAHPEPGPVARRRGMVDSGPEVGTVALATRIVDVVTRSYTVDTVVLDLPMTAGVVTFPRQGDDAATLLQRAAGALHSARRADLAVYVWDAVTERSDTRSLALAGELRRVLDGGRGCGTLEVHYQPTIALSTGELVGAEALVRWEHPVHGLLPPDEFISMAERTGLVAPLTREVLARSLAQCAAWERAGLVLRIAVNLSQRALYEPGFPGHVRDALAAAGLEADRLTLELTESGVMNDPVRALPPLQELAALGVHLAVDDFGTGYSSLAYLRRLPVDEIKIDKSFVLSMGSSDGDTAIVETIIGLGHSLGLLVVAEGVEDEVSRGRLRRMGCDVAQGYLISRPLSPERFDSWIRTRTEWVQAGEGAGARRLRVVGG